VEAYAAERGFLDFDGQRFVDYYASADWHDSKGNPVRNWKQKLLAVWLKDDGDARKREPRRGDPDWLPTEDDLEAAKAAWREGAMV
jgi:hypothetical protein